MDTVGHQCQQQGLDKRQCQKQVRMILSFMDDKFVGEFIQDSAGKKTAKRVVLNLLTRKKETEKLKRFFVE